LTFNMQRAGRKRLEAGPSDWLLELVLHELGHDFSGDHLSRRFHEGLCTLGRRLARLALDRPELFEGWED
jgi:hypothetical protein